ncbi:putative ABC transporter ATP-binding protein YxlF [Peptococcaceae bacterium CEB3]|nr:putative ABC transporter ATP-binding protein YxlF [Peptococcaceae bacterium CEB3]
MLLETQRLTKMYGSAVGCAEVSLALEPGQIFGFLGPNGAGKSTFIKMLVGLLKPTSGTATVLGQPLGNSQARRKVGFLPENFRYQAWLSGQELLSFHADLSGLSRSEKSERIPRLLEEVGLADKARARVGSYSKGMQQRLGLACALLPDPDLIFLDEPSSALDPLGRREVRQLMLNLRDRGKTVFLNSHLLGEVEMICDRVAIVNRGHIVRQGRMADLLTRETEIELSLEKMSDELLADLTRLCPSPRRQGPHLILSVPNRAMIPRVVQTIAAHGAELYSLRPLHVSLEELFVDLLEKGDRQDAGEGGERKC